MSVNLQFLVFSLGGQTVVYRQARHSISDPARGEMFGPDLLTFET